MVDMSATHSVRSWRQMLFVWLLFSVDEHNNTLALKKALLRRRLTTVLTVGNIRHIVGNYQHADNNQEESFGDNGPASSAILGVPIGMAYDTARGKLYISESDTGVIRKIGIAPPPILQTNDYGMISTIPPPQPHFLLDDPHGISIDMSTGDLYVCETGRSAVHKFVYPFSGPLNGSANAVGVSTMITVAGIRGISGFSGDLGPATSAKLYFPSSVVVIPASVSIGNGGIGVGTNLFICDWYNNRVRLVSGLTITQGSSSGPGTGTGTGTVVSINNGVTGTITTIAGGGAINSRNGDGGPATSAILVGPYAAALDNTGTLLYISEYGAHTVRVVSLSTGTITTVAGQSGKAGYAGDSSSALTALLNGPKGIAVDHGGNLIIADSINEAVRYLSSSGIIYTIAGGHPPGCTVQKIPGCGDNGASGSAWLNSPTDVVFDEINQRVLVVDSLNYVVRSVDMTCPLAYAPVNGAGQCVLPASSLVAIILVGVVTPLLCILASTCAVIVYMARKERREEEERLAKAAEAARIEAERLAEEERLRLVALIVEEVPLPVVKPKLEPPVTWKHQHHHGSFVTDVVGDAGMKWGADRVTPETPLQQVRRQVKEWDVIALSRERANEKEEEKEREQMQQQKRREKEVRARDRAKARLEEKKKPEPFVESNVKPALSIVRVPLDEVLKRRRLISVGLLPSLEVDGQNARLTRGDLDKNSLAQPLNQPWGTRKPSRRRQEASITMNRLLSTNNNTPILSPNADA